MTQAAGKTPTTILIVEDNPEDLEATIRAFDKSGLRNSIAHCEDGDDALDYLYQRGPYKGSKKATRPSVILLDLNLPGTDGWEVLAEIKQHPDFKTIPIIILTTSSAPCDIEKCYLAGANSYVQKPVDLRGFVKAIERLKNYWFEIVILPNGVPEL